MPRKKQGWITFQSSEEERKLLEEYCQKSQRTKTEILRELLRSLNQPSSSAAQPEVQPGGVADLEETAIKVSARNLLKGIVKRVIKGTVNAEVTLEIAPGVEITSLITRGSADKLELVEGKEAYAVIKSTNVMIAKH